MTEKLQPGTLVKVVRKLETVVLARKRPSRVSFSLRFDNTNEDANYVGVIDDGTVCLYMSSYSDGLAEAITKKGRGPYGFLPKTFVYYFILWNNKPVYVSSADCELVKA